MAAINACTRCGQRLGSTHTPFCPLGGAVVEADCPVSLEAAVAKHFPGREIWSGDIEGLDFLLIAGDVSDDDDWAALVALTAEVGVGPRCALESPELLKRRKREQELA